MCQSLESLGFLLLILLLNKMLSKKCGLQRFQGPSVGEYKPISPEIFLLWLAMMAIYLLHIATTVKKGWLFTQDVEESWPVGTPCAVIQPSGTNPAACWNSLSLCNNTLRLFCGLFLDLSQRPILDAWPKLTIMVEVKWDRVGILQVSVGL